MHLGKTFYIEDERKRIIEILDEFKYHYQDNHQKLILPVFCGNEAIAFLRPISKNLGIDESSYIRLLAEWRKKNCDAFPTVFKVTEERTKLWMQSQLIERKDRILFMVITADNVPIGHMGLSNFNFEENEAEIDNVVRGVKGVLPGIMKLSLCSLVEWSFGKLGLKRLFLRVFLDNKRAVRFYEKGGFKAVKKINLHKVSLAGSIKYEEITKGNDLSSDRVFLVMERLNNKGKK